jgi:8-oxo-dGTP pyrophosphatase MutT (NUDIX family)
MLSDGTRIRLRPPKSRMISGRGKGEVRVLPFGPVVANGEPSGQMNWDLHEPEEFQRENVAAAVAIMLFGDPAKRVLLIKRRESARDPWSGHVALPGGRREASDGSALDTLFREVHEEVGLDLREGARILGCLPPQAPANRPGMMVLPFVLELDGPPDVRPNREVETHFSVALEDLPSLRCDTEVEVRGRTLHVPAFDVEGEVVWGFTYRVLEEFLGRLRPRR